MLSKLTKNEKLCTKKRLLNCNKEMIKISIISQEQETLLFGKTKD